MRVLVDHARMRPLVVPLTASVTGARRPTAGRVEPARLPAAPVEPPPVPTDAPAFVWTATGLERQVFLDHTGRRGRRVRLAGAGMALLSACWLTTLVTGAIGFSSLPSLPNLPTAARRIPPRLVHVAATHHIRREITETAAVTSPAAVASRELARGETHTSAG